MKYKIFGFQILHMWYQQLPAFCKHKLHEFIGLCSKHITESISDKMSCVIAVSNKRHFSTFYQATLPQSALKAGKGILYVELAGLIRSVREWKHWIWSEESPSGVIFGARMLWVWIRAMEKLMEINFQIENKNTPLMALLKIENPLIHYWSLMEKLIKLLITSRFDSLWAPEPLVDF